jgi:hypothetical protein
MLNVEQVRLLEERVQRVISRTAELQRENGDLRERLEGYQERIRELEAHIETFVSNQAEIEKGVLNALHQLDEVEDAVVEGVQEDRVVTDDDEFRDDESTSPDADEPLPENPADDHGNAGRSGTDGSDAPVSDEAGGPSSTPDDISNDTETSDTNDTPGTGYDTSSESGEDDFTDDDERSGPELDIF